MKSWEHDVCNLGKSVCCRYLRTDDNGHYLCQKKGFVPATFSPVPGPKASVENCSGADIDNMNLALKKHQENYERLGLPAQSE